MGRDDRRVECFGAVRGCVEVQDRSEGAGGDSDHRYICTASSTDPLPFSLPFAPLPSLLPRPTSSFASLQPDDDFEYRHVILPKALVKYLPTDRLAEEDEWRGLGIRQSPGWEHYLRHGECAYRRCAVCWAGCAWPGRARVRWAAGRSARRARENEGARSRTLGWHGWISVPLCHFMASNCCYPSSSSPPPFCGEGPQFASRSRRGLRFTHFGSARLLAGS